MQQVASRKIITINLVVYNGSKYISQCLDSISNQSYPKELIEVNILDNASTDSTMAIVKGRQLQTMNLIESKTNLGMWPGQEELLKQSHGKYIIMLSVDIILHQDFLKNAVETMENDLAIGALQAKVYRYELVGSEIKKTNTIDTFGFKLYRSRRIINIGHGVGDNGQFNKETEIFAVEGAVPIFRKQALEDCRLRSQADKIVDHDYFWYGDDLDTAWRMRLFGWKQVYQPTVIAWHDRQTTKNLANNWREFIKMRRTMPIFKRRLGWRNTILTIIKNDFAGNFCRDLPYILWRELRLWAYFVVFEPSMILEIFKVAKMLPKMLKRRSEIMQKAKISSKEFRRWIN